MAIRLRATEAAEQQALFHWASIMESREPRLRLLYHIPNGGYRFKSTAGQLKTLGVGPGVPDLCLPCPARGYHGLYIEMKASNGKVSNAQGMWVAALCEQGYDAVVLFGWVSVMQHLCWYLERNDILG